MTTVKYSQYAEDLRKFINKHSKKCDWKVTTSPFENNRYHKTYTFEDGAQFIEINEMDVTEEVDVQVHELTFKTTVHLIRHEYWSTDDASSKYWYEAR